MAGIIGQCASCVHDQQLENAHEQSTVSGMDVISANVSAQKHVWLADPHDTSPSIVSTDQSGSSAGSTISGDDPSPVLTKLRQVVCDNIKFVVMGIVNETGLIYDHLAKFHQPS